MGNLCDVVLWDSNLIKPTIRRQNTLIKWMVEDIWQLTSFCRALDNCMRFLSKYFMWKLCSLPYQLIYLSILDRDKYHWYLCCLCCTSRKTGEKLLSLERWGKISPSQSYRSIIYGVESLCDSVLIGYLRFFSTTCWFHRESRTRHPLQLFWI